MNGLELGKIVQAIRELVTLVLPIILEIIVAMRDKELRAIAQELKDAKTKDEKREAARKIADAIASRR